MDKQQLPDMQVVYEQHEHMAECGGPYGIEKAGVRIDDKVFWLGALV